jgi:MFS family permease
VPARFNRLLAASTLSNLGDGVVIAAFPLLAASLSSSPQVVAGMTAAATLPWLLFGLPAGVVVDRVDRVRLMWMIDLARAAAVAVLGLLIVQGTAGLPVLYSVVFVLGMAETLFDSAAMAVVPAVIEGPALERANGRLFAAQLTANQFVGPPLGALLFGKATSLPPLVDALTFVASAALLIGIKVQRDGVPVKRRSLPTELREGLTWVWRQRDIRSLAVGAAVINLAHTGAMAVLVLWATDILGLSDVGFGALFVVAAVGALLGSLSAGRVAGKLGRKPTVLISILAMAISLMAIGLTRSVVVTSIGMLTMSVGAEFWNVVAVSYRQSATPDRLRGRVMSAYRFIAYGSFPIGALLGGWIADRFGLQATFVAGGVIIGVLLAFMTRRLGDLSAEEAATIDP